MGGSIVVGHDELNAVETEEEGETAASPATAVNDLGEGVGSRVHLIQGRLGENDNDDDESDAEVDNHVRGCEAGERLDTEAVDKTVQSEKSNVETDSGACGSNVATVGDNVGPSKDHLGQTVFGTGDTSDLAGKVEPTGQPSDEGTLVARDEETGSRVETTSGRVGRDELSNGKTEGHVEARTDEPGPNGGSGTTEGERAVEGGCDGRDETHDGESV